MLDLELFRIPAFVGISVVAFTLAASIFAMFLYLTLYIQDDLGYGPLAAGARFLPLTLMSFGVAFFAGRLTVRVHSRLLLGIGMVLITGGLLFMATTNPHSAWTVLLPGFLLCRGGRRHGQPGPRLGRRVGRAAAAQRHGLGGQQHVPPGGDRHRHRRPRRRLPEPDRGAHVGRVGQDGLRIRGAAPRRHATAGRHGRGRGAAGGVVHPGPGGAPRPAAGVPRRLLDDAQPSDGDRGDRGLRRCGGRLRPRAPERLRDPRGGRWRRRDSRAARSSRAARPPSPPPMPEPFALEGTHVRLEPLSEAHIPALVEAAGEDRSAYEWTYTPDGEAEMTAYVNDALASVAAGRTWPSPRSGGAAVRAGATAPWAPPGSARSPAGNGRRAPATSATGCPTSATSATPGWRARRSGHR